MKNRSVTNYAGGGGPLLTGTIEESKAYNCHFELRERAEAQSDNVKSICHPELDSGSVQRCELSVSLDRFRNKFGMTVKGIVCMSAFTMAEILLSLTIIGVVAAITLPSLTGNINERTWNTQRKALYARFSQAIALMPSLNGYGTLTEDESGSVTEDTAAETFVTAGLSKVLKINNICDYEHLADCGIPSKITALNGSNPYSAYSQGLPETLVGFNPNFDFDGGDGHHSYSQTDTKIAAFETANGESIAVYYNPNCRDETGVMNNSHYVQPYMCANFIYDLNGTKGPNTVGKDIGFITAFNPVDSVVVAPVPLTRDIGRYNLEEGRRQCTKADSDSRLPNHAELKSMFVNRFLVGLADSDYDYLSSSLLEPGKYWRMAITVGTIYVNEAVVDAQVRCVKR